jgi:hypothetical protein
MPSRAAPGRCVSSLEASCAPVWEDLPLPMRCPTLAYRRHVKPAAIRGPSFCARLRCIAWGSSQRSDKRCALYIHAHPACVSVHICTYMLHGHAGKQKAGEQRRAAEPPLCSLAPPRPDHRMCLSGGVVKTFPRFFPPSLLPSDQAEGRGACSGGEGGFHARSTTRRVALHGRVFGKPSRFRCWCRARRTPRRAAGGPDLTLPRSRAELIGRLVCGAARSRQNRQTLPRTSPVRLCPGLQECRAMTMVEKKTDRSLINALCLTWS